MKNIQLIHEGKDSIMVSYQDIDGSTRQVEIQGSVAVEIIKTLGKALLKNSFVNLGSLGGKARASKLSAEQRSAIARKGGMAGGRGRTKKLDKLRGINLS